MGIQRSPGQVVEGQDGANQEYHGEQETIKGRRHVVASHSEQGDVDQSHDDPSDALTAQYSVHIPRRETSRQSKQSSLEDGGEDVEDDHNDQSEDEEL